jgi:hypothetical protein
VWWRGGLGGEDSALIHNLRVGAGEMVIDGLAGLSLLGAEQGEDAMRSVVYASSCRGRITALDGRFLEI